MINTIITALTSTSSITNLVPADNIFPVFRLQGSTIPAITVQLVDTEPIETKDTDVDLDVNLIEITTFHQSPKSAWRVATTIRQRLQGYAGDDVIDTRFVTQATDIFESTEVHSITQRYNCHTRR